MKGLTRKKKCLDFYALGDHDWTYSRTSRIFPINSPFPRKCVFLIKCWFPTNIIEIPPNNLEKENGVSPFRRVSLTSLMTRPVLFPTAPSMINCEISTSTLRNVSRNRLYRQEMKAYLQKLWMKGTMSSTTVDFMLKRTRTLSLSRKTTYKSVWFVFKETRRKCETPFSFSRLLEGIYIPLNLVGWLVCLLSEGSGFPFQRTSTERLVDVACPKAAHTKRSQDLGQNVASLFTLRL